MPADVIHVSGDEDEARQSSPSESVAQPVEGPSLRVRRGGPANYKECSDVETKVSSTMDDADYESTGPDEDIPSKKPSAKQNKTPRKSRPQSEKQNAEDAAGQQTKQTRVVVKPTKRSGDDDQLEPQRPAKRGRPPSATTEIKTFKNNLEGLLDQYKSKSQEVESLRQEIQDLKTPGKELEFELEKAQQAHKKSHNLLKQENTRLQGKNLGLQDEVQELLTEIDELQKERDKLSVDVRRWKRELIAVLDKEKQDDSKYVKVTDSEIEEAWMTLSFNVRDLVSRCLTERPSNQDEMLALLAKSDPLLSLGDIRCLRASILRKAIWRQLLRAVFLAREPIWHGILGQFLTQQLSGKDYALVADPRYLKIISQTKSKVIPDLSEDGHLNLTAVDAQVDIALKTLSPFFPADRAGEVRQSVKKLFEEAVKLHATLMGSKAIFLVKWTREHNGTDPVTYDSTSMEPVFRDPGAGATNIAVKFVEAPGVLKIGNADGEGFEHGMMLCKSRVILEEEEDEDDDEDDDDEDD